MRIIFFNIWHGQVWDLLKKFILKESSKTDIFCFLEVQPDLQIKLQEILPDFEPIYQAGLKTNYLGGVIEGRSIFVKNKIEISKSGNISIFKETKTDAGGFQYAQLLVGQKTLFIGEVHGKARPGTKMDTPARLRQSHKIIDFAKDIKGPKIIGGDFNLLPETESVLMFEKAGYKNLIKEFNVKSTRNKISWEQFKDQPGFVKQHFADYVFVSSEIKIKSFEVPYLEISDHLPLILDFEI